MTIVNLSAVVLGTVIWRTLHMASEEGAKNCQWLQAEQALDIYRHFFSDPDILIRGEFVAARGKMLKLLSI